TGSGTPRWQYASKSYSTFEAYWQGSGQDALGRKLAQHSAGDPRPAENEPVPALTLHDAAGKRTSLSEFAGKWLLAGFVSAAPERDVASRGQITLLESAQAQFRAVGLRVIVIA